MLFSKAIPDVALQSPNTQRFVDLLDGLQCYKQNEISDALRVYNPILCTSAKWLSYMAADYGFEGISEDYPILPLQQLILNADVIRRLCGTKLGLQLFISAATLGEVTINDVRFIQDIEFLFPDSPVNGFLTASTDKDKFYLCNNNDYMAGTFLDITISSIYMPTAGNPDTPQSTAIKTFLQNFLPKFIGFSENNTTTWTWNHRNTEYYHTKLNHFFYE